MYALIFIWGLIAGTALVFSKESDILWRKVFSVEVNEAFRAWTFYISIVMLVILAVLVLYFYTLRNIIIILVVIALWCLLIKATARILSRG